MAAPTIQKTWARSPKASSLKTCHMNPGSSRAPSRSRGPAGLS